MGRRRMYADAADKQRAYRRRDSSGQAAPRAAAQGLTREPARVEQNIVTPAQGQIIQRYDIAPRAAPVRAAGGHTGTVYQHTAAAGLLVRVDGELAGGRVLATVLSPGQSNLTAGTAYPFKIDLLNEVHP